MFTRICPECGKEFQTNHPKRKFCYDQHYRTCKTCGKVYPESNLIREHYCSQHCASVGAANHENHMKPRFLRVCEGCGSEFYATTPNARVCDKQHYLTCKACGKVFPASRSDIMNKKLTCSKECRYRLMTSTYEANNGKEANPEGHAKLQAKYQQSMLAKYGVDNPMKSKDIQSRAISKKRELYGEHMEVISQHISNTIESRYGVKYMMQSPEFKEKARQTCIEKYGVDNYAKSAEFLGQVIIEPNKAEICKEFRDDPRKFIDSHFTEGLPTLVELSRMCGIRESSVGWIICQKGCEDMVNYTFSNMEDEVYQFLASITDTKIVRNTFQVITPYELDIYLPEYNFAIECDPTITHNSTKPGFGPTDEPKPKNYHKMKTDLCEAQGIFLFHIFGYDWTNKKDVVKSMICSILGISERTIYARNTVIREVSDRDSMEFLSANHRQGGAHSKIRLGLYAGDELISLMTFSEMRNTIGTGKFDSTHCFELVRFCSKLNTSVVGGASKLFHHFVKQYDPQEIRSFSDRAHTRGNLYELLGFRYDHTTDPGYMWVKLSSDAAYSRNNAQKNNIKSFLNDDTIDLTQSEVQIMSSHNFVQVFDSGVKLWIWQKGEINETQGNSQTS